MRLCDQIDASVFVEHLLPSGGQANRHKKDSCTKYIHHLGSGVIDGALSIGALGEVWFAIRKLVPPDEQEKKLAAMNFLLSDCQITFNSPSGNVHRITAEILGEDPRIEPADALRVAEAIDLKRDRFVTLDIKLIESRIIQAKMKIVYPN